MEQLETKFKELCNKFPNVEINSNINNEKTPLENLEAMVDKHLTKDNENIELEQKTLSFKDSYNSNKFFHSMSGAFISMDIINRDSDLGYLGIERDLPIGHTLLSTREDFEVERNSLDCFTSNLAEYTDDSGDHKPTQNNKRIMIKHHPIDLYLEKNISHNLEDIMMSESSYFVDLESGLVYNLLTKTPEGTEDISNSKVIKRNKEIRDTNILTESTTCVSSSYLVQRVDSYYKTTIKNRPLIIMYWYSAGESKNREKQLSSCVYIYMYVCIYVCTCVGVMHKYVCKFCTNSVILFNFMYFVIYKNLQIILLVYFDKIYSLLINKDYFFGVQEIVKLFLVLNKKCIEITKKTISNNNYCDNKKLNDVKMSLILIDLKGHFIKNEVALYKLKITSIYA